MVKSGPLDWRDHEKAERRDAVLSIFRRGTREDLRALLNSWDYSEEEIEAALVEYDAALGQNLLSLGIGLRPPLPRHPRRQRRRRRLPHHAPDDEPGIGEDLRRHA